MKNSNGILGIYTLLFVLFSLPSCSAQNKIVDLSGFSKAQMKYEDGSKVIDSTKLIKRENRNVVRISFYEVFEDSIVLYINNKQIWTGSVYKKNNPSTSSGWCGFDLNFALKGKNNIATIKLINQKEYIQFQIFREFPLYIIQRYDSIWTVRSLMNSINAK